jgi:Mn-dependent DtxR family transcriptional regulator
MTHEFLAQMLGVRRASVTVTVGILQRAGFVEFRRGRVTVVDRGGLEGAACECYRLTREVYDRLLP